MFFKKCFLTLIIFLLLTSCEDNFLGWNLYYEYLDITLDTHHSLVLEYDNNGFYHIEFDPLATYLLDFETTPFENIYWGFSNNFLVEWIGANYEQPKYNSLLSSGDIDGGGVQLYFLDHSMIGDTLSIFGYISETMYDGIVLIIHDNQ